MRTAFARLTPFLVFAAFAGCDCGETVAPIDHTPPLPHEEKTHRVLTYVGDNPLELIRGDTAILRFTWKTVGGAPVSGEMVSLSTESNLVALSGLALTTDSGGAVSVNVTAGESNGDALVRARASDIDGVLKEANVVVRVVEDPVATLDLTVASQTRIVLDRADAAIYVSPSPPSCAQVQAGTAVGATRAGTFVAFPSLQRFDGLTTGNRATVFATGYNADGVKVGVGCAELPSLVGGVVTPVTVTIAQDSTLLTGDYDVLLHMALGDALPSPYDETLDLVTALLADPAGYATYLVLREIDRSLDYATWFVTRDGVEMSYRDLERDPADYPTWSYVRAALDDQLTQSLGQNYTDVTDIGAGLRDVVTDFEVGARFDVRQGTGANGFHIDETWRDLVLYWPYGCPAGDLACARRALLLDDPSRAPVTTSYNATWAHTPRAGQSEAFTVTTDPHGMSLRYGAIMLIILEQVVFPSLPEGTAGDSLGDVLVNLVGCADIAAAIEQDSGAAAGLLAETVCEQAMDGIANEVESRLLELEFGAADPELGPGNSEGFLATGSLDLVDVDHDLVAEGVDRYAYRIAWNTPGDPEATADIGTDITGDGRRTLATCSADGDCADGFACQAFPHYLKVAQVQMGCGRGVGGLAGLVACTSDASCQSGLCEPVGVGDALACFSACADASDCSGSASCSVAGAVDLDGVLNGLGDVPVQGCTAP